MARSRALLTRAILCGALYQTFCEYCPSLFGEAPFKKHPDILHETTCLSSLIPPKTNYKLCISKQTILHGLLTSAQLEAVVLASAQHELRIPGHVPLCSRAALLPPLERMGLAARY